MMTHKLQELDDCGDRLPTFRHTYDEYKDILKEAYIDACDFIRKVEGFKSSREFRRKIKKKNKSIDVIKSL